jgi:hypothetical protein
MNDKMYKTQMICGFIGAGVWIGAGLFASTWEWAMIGFTMSGLCFLGVQQTWENWQFHNTTLEARQRWNTLLNTVESEISEIVTGEKK